MWTGTALSGQGLCGHSKDARRLPLDRYPSLGFTAAGVWGQEAENFGRVLLGFSSHQKYYHRDTKSGSSNLKAQALRPLG